MAFKDATVMVGRELRMFIAEFLTTDIAELMADQLMYVLAYASISFENGLGAVKLNF